MKHAPRDTILANKEYELEKRLGQVSERLRQLLSHKTFLLQGRTRYLRNEAERLLPDLSESTKQNLNAEHPRFMTREVRDVFIANKKLFGIFKRKDYDVALFSLRVDLTHHLELTRTGDLPKLDLEIAELDAEVGKLADKKVQLTKVLTALRAVKTNGRPLSPRLSNAIKHGVNPTKAPTTPPQPQVYTNNYTTVTDDNGFDDLLTLLLLEQQFSSSSNSPRFDPPFEGKGGTFDGGGASGDWSSDNAPVANNNNNGSGIGAAVGIAAGIATDDSLGRFS